MYADLTRALLAAVGAGVLPGIFWARFLRAERGWGLAWSAALSMATVPMLALAAARILHQGVSLKIAVAAAAAVLVSGWLALIARGRPGRRGLAGLARLARGRRPEGGPLRPGGLASASYPEGGGRFAHGPGPDGTAPGSAGQPSPDPVPAFPRPGGAPGPGGAPAPAAYPGPGGFPGPGGLPGFGTFPGTGGVPASTLRRRRGSGIPGGVGPDGAVLPLPAVAQGWWVSLLIAAAGVIALISLSTGQTPGWQIIAILALMAVAGLLVTAWPVLPAGVRTGTGARRAGADAAGTAGPAAAVPGPRAAAPATEADWAALRARGKLPWHRRAWVRRSLLTLVLLMIAVRDYAGPVGYDWPYLRGSDQFSHAVMAQEVLAHGAYGSYLVYPPGFASLSAVICRFSGLPPLRLYPVLAPALLVLTAVAAYALAVKLWGFWPGLAAAFLSGLVLSGSYASFAAGRYPDLTAAYFLLVMAVAALVTLYQQPSVRSVLLVAVLSASVVFYHSVASLYIALVLAVAGLAGLVWLVIARGGGGAAQRLQARRLTAALAGALACTAVLAAGYAAYTYLHGNAAGGQSATSTAVNIALNSQPAYGGATILDTLGAPVVWLGVLGLAALAAGLVRLRRPGQVMAAVTLLLWCVVMYLGSRFAFDGFPVRFETDLGGPLAVVGAFGLVLVLRSLAGLARWRSAGRALAAVLSVAAAGTLLSTAGLQVTEDAQADIAPVPGGILIKEVADAGAFLRRHNTGGTIITTPGMNAGITNRAVLAMGGYTGLQSYSAYRTEHPRSLPTAGLVPLLDSREVLHNPLSCRTATIITRQHVKFIVMYRPGHIDELLNFRQDPSRYRQVFRNAYVVIFATPEHLPPCTGP
jgi:hypothetical protein